MSASKTSAEALIDQLWANPSEIREKPWNLIHTILSNIVTHPEEPKFKKLSIEKVIPRLHPAKGAVELLENLGFVNESGHFLWKSPCIEPLQDALDYMLAISLSSLESASDSKRESKASSKCCSSASAYCNAKAAPTKTAAQLELERVQAENARTLAELKAKKEKEREVVRKQIEGSRKEKKDEQAGRPAVKSVANPLNFGCKVGCLPPPAQGGGGG